MPFTPSCKFVPDLVVKDNHYYNGLMSIKDNAKELAREIIKSIDSVLLEKEMKKPRKKSFKLSIDEPFDLCNPSYTDKVKQLAFKLVNDAYIRAGWICCEVTEFIKNDNYHIKVRLRRT